MAINKVCVIGAGVMGSGIAAQIVNAGVPVILLDIVPKEATDRNVIAKGAVAKMLKTDPAPLMSKRNAKLIEVGNLEDDLDKIGECDWIVEVVLEDLKIKHATYEKIQKHRQKGSIVTSNTSTIPLAKLAEGQPKEFTRDFMITHFFNPPRYMRLLELVVSKDTDFKAIKTIKNLSPKKKGFFNQTKEYKMCDFISWIELGKNYEKLSNFIFSIRNSSHGTVNNFWFSS